jgi:hypothetical protein
MVSRHAVERLRERFGLEIPFPQICAEVGAAIRAGRTAKNQPRWAVWDRTKRGKAQGSHGTGLFVWPADRSRCWMIVRSKHRETLEPIWQVVTVLKADR